MLTHIPKNYQGVSLDSNARTVVFYYLSREVKN